MKLSTCRLRLQTSKNEQKSVSLPIIFVYVGIFLYLCTKFTNMAKFIIQAEEGERELREKVLALMSEAARAEWSQAEVIYTGVGGINIIRALQTLPRESEILNIGYAGSANFEVGTWAQVTEVRLNHPNVTYPEPTLDNFSILLPDQEGICQAVCYTNCDFVLASDYKDCVFDMELAFIAALGFAKIHSLKYVSDNLSLHDYHDFTHGVE